MESSPKVAIVILNWNGWNDTLDLLENFQKVEYPNLMLIVIDNASTDKSVQRITQWIEDNQKDIWEIYQKISIDRARKLILKKTSKHIFVALNENSGFCKGNNIGMEIGFRNGADYALIINNDTLVTPSFLKALVEAGEQHPDAGLIGGIITYCSKPDIIWWAGGVFDSWLGTKRLFDGKHVSELKIKEPYETEWISGCMMMVRKEVFLKIGGFYEPFFIWSDEWDYSLRVRKAGYRRIVAPQSRICHKVGRSLGVLKPLSYYYGTRNGLLLKKMYLPSWKWRLFVPYYLATRVIRYGLLALKGRWDLVHAGTWALIDALRGKEGKWDFHDKI